MNNRRDWAYDSPYPRSLYQQSSEDSSAVTRITTTIALLVLGYYALNFLDLWPSTLKRRAHETFIDLFPTQLILLIQSVMTRVGVLSRDTPRFKLEDLTSRQAKSNVLRELLGFENNRITTAVRKARTLSGIDNILPSSTEIGPAGLGNWDNSCYQNSVLHGFASLPAFNAFVSKSWDLVGQKGTLAPTHEALVGFLGKLSAVDLPKRTLWTPAVLKSMDSWQQQDAQEYFSRVLDAVEKEDVTFYKTNRRRDGLEKLAAAEKTEEDAAGMVPAVAEETMDATVLEPEPPAEQRKTSRAAPSRTADIPERNPLDGMLAQSLKCCSCGFTEGLSLTQFNCITVNLGTAGGSCTLEQLLDEYTEPEDIDGVECTQCTKLANAEPKFVEGADMAKQESNALPSSSSDQATEPAAEKSTPKKPKPILSTKSKQLTLARLPPDLVIHLNRSIFDTYGNQRKNTAWVDFSLRLGILNRWCAPLDQADGRFPQAVYALKCIVTHAGRHDDGHYIAYAKRGKEWYCCNDEVVTRVSEEWVRERGNAFMLFYEVEDSPASAVDGRMEELKVGREDVNDFDLMAVEVEEEDEDEDGTAISGQVSTADPEVVDPPPLAETRSSALSSQPPMAIPRASAEDATKSDPEENDLLCSTAISAPELMGPTAEAEAQPPVHRSTPLTTNPSIDDSTISSSTATSDTATSDTELEETNQAVTRPVADLPPMRTASESSTMHQHQRMESSHAAPVF